MPKLLMEEPMNTQVTERPPRTDMMTGLFRDRESAEQAYESLRTRGYGEQDVNLLLTDATRKHWYPGDKNDTALGQKATGTKAMAGAGVGGAVGTTVGAVLAVVAATATVAIPGLGLLAAGPVAAALAGAGAGGVAGGVIGAMVGAGIPDDRAKLYDEELKRGGMVMGVTPRSDEDAAFFEHEWRNSRGEHIYR
jgi:hypothetical protein